MIHKIIYPCSELSRIVKYFWVFEGEASKSSPFYLRTMASGFPELIFHYKGTFSEVLPNNKISSSFIAGIHGQTDKFRDFVICENFGMIGVHLYPYSIRALFNITSSELINELPELSALPNWNRDQIEIKILSAKGNEERIAILSTYLISALKETPDSLIVNFVNKIIEMSGVIEVKSLSKDSSYSHRQFERKFKEAVGFSAKHFSRLIRFNKVLHSSPKSISLTQMAFDFGYYDQSHFTNEFKQFSGIKPSEHFTLD